MPLPQQRVHLIQRFHERGPDLCAVLCLRSQPVFFEFHAHGFQGFKRVHIAQQVYNRSQHVVRPFCGCEGAFKRLKRPGYLFPDLIQLLKRFLRALPDI